jgi:hypothetical protein
MARDVFVTRERWEQFCQAIADAPPPRPDDTGTQCAITFETLTPEQVEQRRALNRHVRLTDPANY